MNTRRQYTRDVICTECGQIGLLHISENDSPFMKKLHRAVENREGKFSATMHGDADIVVKCRSCGHVFIE